MSGASNTRSGFGDGLASKPDQLRPQTHTDLYTQYPLPTPSLSQAPQTKLQISIGDDEENASFPPSNNMGTFTNFSQVSVPTPTAISLSMSLAGFNVLSPTSSSNTGASYISNQVNITQNHNHLNLGNISNQQVSNSQDKDVAGWEFMDHKVEFPPMSFHSGSWDWKQQSSSSHEDITKSLNQMSLSPSPDSGLYNGSATSLPMSGSAAPTTITSTSSISDSTISPNTSLNLSDVTSSPNKATADPFMSGMWSSHVSSSSSSNPHMHPHGQRNPVPITNLTDAERTFYSPFSSPPSTSPFTATSSYPPRCSPSPVPFMHPILTSSPSNGMSMHMSSSSLSSVQHTLGYNSFTTMGTDDSNTAESTHVIAGNALEQPSMSRVPSLARVPSLSHNNSYMLPQQNMPYASSLTADSITVASLPVLQSFPSTASNVAASLAASAAAVAPTTLNAIAGTPSGISSPPGTTGATNVAGAPTSMPMLRTASSYHRGQQFGPSSPSHNNVPPFLTSSPSYHAQYGEMNVPMSPSHSHAHGVFAQDMHMSPSHTHGMFVDPNASTSAMAGGLSVNISMPSHGLSSPLPSPQAQMMNPFLSPMGSPIHQQHPMSPTFMQMQVEQGAGFSPNPTSPFANMPLSPSSMGTMPGVNAALMASLSSQAAMSSLSLTDLLASHVLPSLCSTQHGARFIQSELEVCTNPSIKQAVFQQLLPYLFRLSTHPFANYVVQKLIDTLPTPSYKNIQPMAPPPALFTPKELWNEELADAYRAEQDKVNSCIIPRPEMPNANAPNTPWTGLNTSIRSPPLPANPEVSPAYYCLLMLRAFNFGAGLYSLCIDPFGCRVVQRILDACATRNPAAAANASPHLLEAQQLLLHHIGPHFFNFSVHQHANHVIQKCIENIPLFLTHKALWPLFDPTIAANADRHPNNPVMSLISLSSHTYGCRVTQRVYTHCNEEQRRSMLDQIEASFDILAKDLFGNYVIQHVISAGTSLDSASMVKLLKSRVAEYSMHKCASNVVEKAFKRGDSTVCEALIDEVLASCVGENGEQTTPLQIMVVHPFANYVVQTMLSVASFEQRPRIMECIRKMAPVLRKSDYSKRILSKLEKKPHNRGGRHGGDHGHDRDRKDRDRDE